MQAGPGSGLLNSDFPDPAKMDQIRNCGISDPVLKIIDFCASTVPNFLFNRIFGA